MVFCSTDLAARMERAECARNAALVAQVQARRPQAAALRLPVGGGAATLAEPGSPFNKLSGLGFAPLAASELVALLYVRAILVKPPAVSP